MAAAACIGPRPSDIRYPKAAVLAEFDRNPRAAQKFAAGLARQRLRAAQLQAAIDYAIQNGFAEVRLREGRYKTTDTIHLGYGEAFHTIRLVGSSRASFDGLPGVTIYPTATDRPVVSSIIVNIGFARFE